MGCGTALPSLALFQWKLEDENEGIPLDLTLSDYNPSVLSLVTVPNILLSWAQSKSRSSNIMLDTEGELEINESLLSSFQSDITDRSIHLNFISGAWSPAFVSLVSPTPKNPANSKEGGLLIIAAETIYSPFALQSFTEALMNILQTGVVGKTRGLVGAKKVYFGVGGSIEDFIEEVAKRDGTITQIREEEDGVRRAVVEVTLE
jgi:hypothetical protein